MTMLKGFTLVELITAMALVAILLTAGIPGLSTLLHNSRLTTAINDFVSHVHFARSEAIRRGSRVTLCKSADGTSCTTQGDWAQGWLVFSDPNHNARLDADETLLRLHNGFTHAQLSLSGNSKLQDYISYTGNGFSRRISGAPQNGTLVLCDSRGFGAHARAIVINNTGRLSNIPAAESSARDCTQGRHD